MYFAVFGLLFDFHGTDYRAEGRGSLWYRKRFEPLHFVPVPVPLIYFFARKVLIWGQDKKFIGKFFTWCIKKGEKGGEKLQKKGGKGLFIALMLFVGIPLPGTGAWTGTLAASFLNMGFKRSVIAVICGVLIAGIIMGFGTYMVKMGAGGIFSLMANS